MHYSGKEVPLIFKSASSSPTINIASPFQQCSVLILLQYWEHGVGIDTFKWDLRTGIESSREVQWDLWTWNWVGVGGV